MKNTCLYRLIERSVLAGIGSVSIQILFSLKWFRRRRLAAKQRESMRFQTVAKFRCTFFSAKMVTNKWWKIPFHIRWWWQTVTFSGFKWRWWISHYIITSNLAQIKGNHIICVNGKQLAHSFRWKPPKMLFFLVHGIRFFVRLIFIHRSVVVVSWVPNHTVFDALKICHATQKWAACHSIGRAVQERLGYDSCATISISSNIISSIIIGTWRYDVRALQCVTQSKVNKFIRTVCALLATDRSREFSGEERLNPNLCVFFMIFVILFSVAARRWASSLVTSGQNCTPCERFTFWLY